jgi:hypothetical protein
MATFKLTPHAIDMEVSIASENLVSLFDRSLTELVEQRVQLSVSANLIEIVNDREYTRKMRDWLVESIDMYDLADKVNNNLDYSQIIDAVIPDGYDVSANEKFMKAFATNRYVRSIIESSVNEYFRSAVGISKIEQLIEEKSANMVNDVVERAMVVISQRLSGGSDV